LATPPIGKPHFTQNLELSASWLPQFVQKAMILPLSTVCYEIGRQMFTERAYCEKSTFLLTLRVPDSTISNIPR
jgi:hypothetical protein